MKVKMRLHLRTANQILPNVKHLFLNIENIITKLLPYKQIFSRIRILEIIFCILLFKHLLFSDYHH